MNPYYDLIIIGAGPAGLSAAIYAARAELNFIIIERSAVCGGQIQDTYEVDNYPGIPMVSGSELAGKMREHCDRLKVPFVTGDVDSVERNDDGTYNINMENGTVYETKTIIAATGASHKKLGVPGEEELTGMGVSYCATCDGAFFRGRKTAVVGGGDVAVEDAIFLSRICKQVYLIHRRDEFRAAKTLISHMNTIENIEVITDTVINTISGEDMVEKLIIENIRTQTVSELEVDGVFIAVGTAPASKLFRNLCDCDENGSIKADETGITSAPGIFAAGDVRTKALRQVITAAADGANCVSSVERYLSEL